MTRIDVYHHETNQRKCGNTNKLKIDKREKLHTDLAKLIKSSINLQKKLTLFRLFLELHDQGISLSGSNRSLLYLNSLNTKSTKEATGAVSQAINLSTKRV